MSRCKFTKQSDTLTTVVYESKESPELWAIIVRSDPSFYNITIRLGEDGLLLATAAVFRGTFAGRITRQMIKACMSCLHKRCVATHANRAARKAAKNPVNPVNPV